MKALLYPQIPRSVALQLAEEAGTASIEDLTNQASNTHRRMVFTSTGGSQVSPVQLDSLAKRVRELQSDSTSMGEFDTALARLLHKELSLTRAEGSLMGVWAFFGCVLMPDIVRWRFPGERTPEDRFTGTSRGARNTFGRCWWRGELLFDENPPAGKDNYWLLESLGDDEMAGMIERQRAVTSRRVAVALARALVGVKRKGVSRTALSRDAFKRFLRFGYFVAFDALDDQELRVACESLCHRAARSLEKDSLPPSP